MGRFIEEVNTRRRMFLSFSKLGYGLKNSTPGNFTYICHLKRVEIIATTFGKTRIHFDSNVFAAVAVVVAKAPYRSSHEEGKAEVRNVESSFSIMEEKARIIFFSNDNVKAYGTEISKVLLDELQVFVSNFRRSILVIKRPGRIADEDSGDSQNKSLSDSES